VRRQRQTVASSSADPLEFPASRWRRGCRRLSRKPSPSIDYDRKKASVSRRQHHLQRRAATRDRYSGTIRWNEIEPRSNGMGYYDVNVRLNEKATSEADAFAAATAADAEAAFFATDVSVPGFTGKVSYVDTFEGESVVASKVSYAINSSSASKAQTMNFAKILLLMVGPFNDE
jgi:hypothetical protein